MRAFFLSTITLSMTACGHAATSTDPGPNAPVVEALRTQEILTPLPLRVSLPRSTGAEHVIVLFKPWGLRGWRQIELARSGQTWSGEVSCREVSTVTGDTRYFFLALDEKGDVVGGSGSPSWPHLATIVRALPDGPQSLAGAPLPARCHDVADCPPDFPGCPAYDVRRRACASDGDCKEGVRCAWDGYCGAPSDSADPSAVTNLTEDEELEAAIRAVTSRYRRTATARKPSDG